MPYAKLRGRIKEQYNTVEKCAEACKMSPAKLYNRLSGKVVFTVDDIFTIAEALGLQDTELRAYFFS